MPVAAAKQGRKGGVGLAVALTVVLVVLAGQGRYLICRFDPFVGIFRGGGSWGAWRALAGILLVGVIVAIVVV